MPRINIEDSLFKDNRFINLAIKSGGMQNALGKLVWAFMIAQKHFMDESNDRMIPIEDWKKQNCDDMIIEVGLAEVSRSGVYVSGSEKQFAWLLQRVEAGRKGGKASKRNYNLRDEELEIRKKARKKLHNAVYRGLLKKPDECSKCHTRGVTLEGHHDDYEKPLDVVWLCSKCHNSLHKIKNELHKQSIEVAKRSLAVAKPLNSLLSSHTQYSLLNSQSTDSVSTSGSSSNELQKKLKPQKGTPVDAALNREIFLAYADAYRQRYGVDPTRNATVNTQISQLGKRLGKEAVQVIRFYVQHNEGFYVKKSHPVGLCLSDAESLRTQWLRGKQVTTAGMRQFEKTQATRETVQAIMEEGI